MTYGTGNSGNYKKLKGQTIQAIDTDPVVYAGAWSTGGSLNTTRALGLGAGTQTAALMASGYTSPPYSAKNQVELYNGTSWTETAEVNTARSGFMGGGTQTSAIGASGSTAETWNGSAWTEVSELNTTRSGGGGVGQSSSAAFAYGGYVGPPRSAVAEVWNGSSWTEVGDLNAAKDEQASVGITTSALSVGGTVSGLIGQNESWDNSSWTELADINTTRSGVTGSGDNNTTGIVFGGYTPSLSATTESWNGSIWTEVGDLNTARKNGTPAGYPGGQDDALMIAGITSTQVANVEEWSFPSTPVVQEGQLWIKTATGTTSVMKGYAAQGTGAFAAGGAIPAVKSAHGYAGTQNAGVAFAGATSTTAKVATSFEYNGTAWSNAEDVNTTRDLCAGAGTQTAAILFGGTLPPGGHSNATELYDGTNWTTSPGTFSSQARSRIGPLGTQTAALAVSGTPISPVDQAVESWNGSSWTEIAEINTSRINGGAAGIQTAGLFFGGEDPLRALTEKWDGTAWTEVGDMNTARQSSGMGAGIQTAAMAIGGEVSPGFTANTETFNGSSWTEVANLGTARGYHACGGSQVLAIATGGRTPTFVANTEEWTVPFATKTIGTD